MSSPRATMKQLTHSRTLVIAIVVTLVVVLVWLVAFFNPQGHKLSGLQTQEQQAQSEQLQLESQLAILRADSKESPVLRALSQKLSAAVPSSDGGNYVYLGTTLPDTATAAGVHIESISPGTPVPAGSVSVTPISVATQGTYDQTLAFIKALYALPRLTVVTNLQLGGGGPGTTRGTVLQETIDLDIFAQASPSAATKTG